MSDLAVLVLMACAVAGVILFCWAHSAAEQVETTHTGETWESQGMFGYERRESRGSERS